MPALALPLPPATANAAVAQAGPASQAMPGTDAAADATAASPFASVLQEQLAAQILVPLLNLEDAPTMEEAAQAMAADPMLAMLPGLEDPLAEENPLVGLAPVQPALMLDPNAPVQAGTDESDETAALPADAASLVPLALPVAAPQAVAAQEKFGAANAPADRPAAVSAQSSAILAATADDGHGKGKALGHGEESFAGAVGEAVTARAETLPPPQAQQARAAEHAARIEAPVGTRQWDGEFANRLAWMVNKQEQRAELVLNPPQLGRIEVSVSVNGEQATAIFTSASATVRDAIENALPRLREVLLESGINLGQTQVGSESMQQSPTRDENGDNRGRAIAAGQEDKALPPGFAVNSPTAWVRSGRGMIDVFA